METRSPRKRSIVWHATIGPIAIVVLASVLAVSVYSRFETELLERFRESAEHSLMGSTTKLDNYRDLLYSGRAFYLSTDSVNVNEWRSFYNQQAVFERYPGVSSIALVEEVPTNELAAFETRMKSREYFGPSYKLGKQSDRPVHGLVSAYASQNDIRSILGVDLLAADSRYTVYAKASEQNSIVASPSFKLATGFDGFFIVLPVERSATTQGYVLASFHYDDLMKRLFSDTSFGYTVSDTTDGADTLLYSKGPQEGAYRYEENVNVGGREWSIRLTRPSEQRPLEILLPAAIIATAILMAVTLYLYSVRAVSRRSTEIE